MRDFAVAAAEIKILKIYPVFVFVQHQQGLIFAEVCEKNAQRNLETKKNKKRKVKREKERKTERKCNKFWMQGLKK